MSFKKHFTGVVFKQTNGLPPWVPAGVENNLTGETVM